LTLVGFVSFFLRSLGQFLAIKSVVDMILYFVFHGKIPVLDSRSVALYFRQISLLLKG